MSDDADLTAAGLLRRYEDGVATVTLNRPDRRNAMTPSMWHGLAQIGMEMPDDIRVVIVRGAGPSFCAGIDLRLFSAEGVPGEPPTADPLSEETIAGYQAGYRWLRDPRWVSIAAVQGHAIGAGFQLALACDLRVLTNDASLCMKEPKLGLVPDLTGTKPLVEIVGLSRAIELCLTSREVAASEAAALRLAEYVVPVGELDQKLATLTKDLKSAMPPAAQATKKLLAEAVTNTLEEQSAAERAAQVALLRARADAAV